MLLFQFSFSVSCGIFSFNHLFLKWYVMFQDIVVKTGCKNTGNTDRIQKIVCWFLVDFPNVGAISFGGDRKVQVSGNRSCSNLKKCIEPVLNNIFSCVNGNFDVAITNYRCFYLHFFLTYPKFLIFL